MESVKKSKRTYADYIRFKILFILALGLLTVAMIIVDVAIGSSGLSVWDVVRTVFGFGDNKMKIIVWNMRMPRVATAVVLFFRVIYQRYM